MAIRLWVCLENKSVIAVPSQSG